MGVGAYPTGDDLQAAIYSMGFIDEAQFGAVIARLKLADKAKAGLFNEAPEATKALDALDRSVTFEFVDTPLGEGVAFLALLARHAEDHNPPHGRIAP